MMIAEAIQSWIRIQTDITQESPFRTMQKTLKKNISIVRSSKCDLGAGVQVNTFWAIIRVLPFFAVCQHVIIKRHIVVKVKLNTNECVKCECDTSTHLRTFPNYSKSF